jgi:ABC-type uncharacterized transport system ATPase subunit
MNTSPDILLSAAGLAVAAGGQALLDAVGVQVRTHEVLGIVGPNGAGKSTLLRVLAGVQVPDTGEVALGSESLAAIAAPSRARFLGYLEQRPFVHWPLSVEQVAGLGRLPHGDASSVQGQAAIDAALAATDTAALRSRAFQTLSEGEKMPTNRSPRSIPGTSCRYSSCCAPKRRAAPALRWCCTTCSSRRASATVCWCWTTGAPLRAARPGRC